MLGVKRTEKKLPLERQTNHGTLCLTEVNETHRLPCSPHEDVTFRREVSCLCSLINIPQYASWRWTPCQRCSPFYPQSCLSMKFFTSSKWNRPSVTVPSCPEVFIVWRCTQALPVSSQMFHCGQSICHCQRWQAVVTMVTVLGLNCWRCRSPQGTTDLTTRIRRAPCTFFARSVSVLWQMSKKCVTSPQPNLSTAMHAGV